MSWMAGDGGRLTRSRRGSGYGAGVNPVRNPFLHPFSSASIWNTSIGSGAVEAPAGLVPALGASGQRVSADPIFYGVWDTDRVEEMRTINYTRRSDGSINGPLTGVYTIPAGTMVHVPSGTVHNAEWNGISFFRVQNSQRYVFHGQAVEVDDTLAPGWARTSDTVPDGTCGPIGLRGYVDLYGHGRVGSHGGSKLSGVGGIIQDWEWDAMDGIWYPQHVLAMNVHGEWDLSQFANGFRWPALKADTGYNELGHQNYYGRTNVGYDYMRMGSLVCLPANYDTSWITDPKAHSLAKTLKGFGAIIVDVTTGERRAFSVSARKEAAWNAQVNMHTQLHTIFESLNCVTNNSPSTPGGGGLPRVTPPIELPPAPSQ